jgi:hypothetical protein
LSSTFPDGSLCRRIFDELGRIFQDQDFADLYSRHGQPWQPPLRLALVTVYRGAADAFVGASSGTFSSLIQSVAKFVIVTGGVLIALA